ncbi:hypothetical protein NQ318_002810 [Aromia moschata]|uniref:DNA-directed DNA polymerase n=1 Tax=Aromia moschata TaxID=1265417 RepID=A0AAV8XRF1_9CUCU|nr:hypothetical protein NQ318_002810 [Aromia moschata]
MKLIQTAFKSRIASYRVHSENRYSDYNMFFESIKNKVIHLLSEVIKIHNAVKVIMELFGRYILQTQKIVDNKSFNTANKVIDSAADLNDVFYVFVDLMTTQMSEFQKRDSGWELQFIMYVEINLNKFCAFVLDIEGMTFPVNLRDISKFELRNNISINVRTLKVTSKTIKSYIELLDRYIILRKNYTYVHINLLLITSECGNSHYCWIKNLSRLVLSQISNSQHKKYFCDGCLLHFSNENLLFQHQQNDCNHLYTSIPSREIKKDKYGAYILEPNPHYSYTNRTFRHEPYSFAYLIKYSFNDSYFLNLNFTVIPNCIPIIFHNMSGYDFHMFIKELFSDKKNANVIAQSKEKYIFFAKYLHVDTYIDKKAYTQHNTHREEAYDSLATVNVVIAAYVTTQVHLKLYSYLELLGGRVLYYDTDSYDVPMGEFLGEITDELESYGPGSYITEFVSGGPKKYAYRVFSTRDKEERVVCKVKAASQLVNFEIIKSMILEPMSAGPVSITSRNILRTK